MITIALICVFLAFTLSASAGLGGSLILVPAMALLLGPKQGIAIAALLLACNNVGKVFVYRKTIPVKVAFSVIILTMLGAMLGASLMVVAPELLVHIAIICSMLLTFILEYKKNKFVRQVSAPIMAFFAGACSGFSGTSGPMKGLALRNLDLERFYFVGAASMVSLAGDVVKALVFTKSELLHGASLDIVLFSLPLIPLSVFLGRHINRTIGELTFAGLFWIVMTGYAVRLFLA